jgi:hypothetical protein
MEACILSMLCPFFMGVSWLFLCPLLKKQGEESKGMHCNRSRNYIDT